MTIDDAAGRVAELGARSPVAITWNSFTASSVMSILTTCSRERRSARRLL